jgi:hypothetical protein
MALAAEVTAFLDITLCRVVPSSNELLLQSKKVYPYKDGVRRFL